MILDGSADQRQRQRAVHRIQRQIQAGEFALAGQNGLEQLRPGIAGKERFELPAALPGHFHMAAHILAPLVVNADIAEAQGLAITGEAEGESREKGRVQADDPGDLLRAGGLEGKAGPIDQGTVNRGDCNFCPPVSNRGLGRIGSRAAGGC